MSKPERDAHALPDPLLDEAMEWLLRVEPEGATPDELNAFGQWLATDDQHIRAYEKVDRYWHEFGKLNRVDF
ncbi:MAG: DUF4880 domain-containing protein [Pseudomonadota bacterium]